VFKWFERIHNVFGVIGFLAVEVFPHLSPDPLTICSPPIKCRAELLCDDLRHLAGMNTLCNNPAYVKTSRLKRCELPFQMQVRRGTKRENHNAATNMFLRSYANWSPSKQPAGFDTRGKSVC
jgi:hypothetical protein